MQPIGQRYPIQLASLQNPLSNPYDHVLMWQLAPAVSPLTGFEHSTLNNMLNVSLYSPISSQCNKLSLIRTSSKSLQWNFLRNEFYRVLEVEFTC
jgi:hypothetical protein